VHALSLSRLTSGPALGTLVDRRRISYPVKEKPARLLHRNTARIKFGWLTASAAAAARR